MVNPLVTLTLIPTLATASVLPNSTASYVPAISKSSLVPSGSITASPSASSSFSKTWGKNYTTSAPVSLPTYTSGNLTTTSRVTLTIKGTSTGSKTVTYVVVPPTTAVGSWGATTGTGETSTPAPGVATSTATGYIQANSASTHGAFGVAGLFVVGAAGFIFL